MRLLRIFYRNIKRLIYWLPVIWNDRDYDHHFFFKIIHHKLLSMKKFFESENALSVPAKKKAKDVDKALKVLNRVLADEYEENAFMWHDKKWGDIKMNSVKVPDGLYKLNISRENVITQEDEEKENQEFHRCFEIAERQRKQDLEYLSKIINKYIYEWWD